METTPLSLLPAVPGCRALRADDPRLTAAPAPTHEALSLGQLRDRGQERVFRARHAELVGVQRRGWCGRYHRLDPADQRDLAGVVPNAGRVRVDERGVVGCRLVGDH